MITSIFFQKWLIQSTQKNTKIIFYRNENFYITFGAHFFPKKYRVTTRKNIKRFFVITKISREFSDKKCFLKIVNSRRIYENIFLWKRKPFSETDWFKIYKNAKIIFYRNDYFYFFFKNDWFTTHKNAWIISYRNAKL